MAFDILDYTINPKPDPMPQPPNISATEWEVMQVIWSARQPISAQEIIARLNVAQPEWHPKTVRALLTRLVAKKAVGYQESGRSYFYYPLSAQSQSLQAVGDSFLQKFFGGSVEPMLMHFVGRYKLSREGAAELRRLLRESEEPEGKDRA